MQALVLKEWKAGEQPIDTEGNYVRIIGRQGGLVAWLLAMLKIDPTTTVKVSNERVEFSAASLSGVEHRMIPVDNVCSSYYCYNKPWKQAVSIFGLFAFLGMLIAGAIPAGGVAVIGFLLLSGAGIGIALLYYFLSRTLTLGFVETSGHVSAIRFKRSVIEGVDVSQDQAAYICKLTQAIVELKKRGG